MKNTFDRLSLKFTLLLLAFNLNSTIAQYEPDIIPVSPEAFSFLKYVENPVSEYSGIPNIQVPIYNIKTGDVDFPLVLTYHSGGIRVNEEAGWVGLGWDLNLGGITQIVNDKDDLDPKTERVIPDYNYIVPTPSIEFPFKYLPLGSTTLNYNYVPGLGINQDEPKYSMVQYTDWYVPLNGQYQRKEYFFNELNSTSSMDSEPDLFKVNVLGHSLTILFEYGSPKVLNHESYLVNYDNYSWEIITPSGLRFYFDKFEETKIDISQSQSRGSVSYHYPQVDVSSRNWKITRIVDSKNNEIKFNWIQGNKVYNIPSLTNSFKSYEFYYKGSFGSTTSLTRYTSQLPSYLGSSDKEFFDYNYTLTNQTKWSLDNISFEGSKILFSCSSREDILGDIKLDNIIVKNHLENIVKQIDFTYDYFEAVDGNNYFNEFTLTHHKTIEEDKKRLKLNTIQEHGKEPYVFSYNTTRMPRKTAFSTDYWGYNNGVISNIWFVPNASHIGVTGITSITNDHRPDLASCKAGVLESMRLPTGGSVNFVYELHQFENSNNLTINTGCGLRIDAIYHKNEMDDTVLKVAYEYEDGKHITPLLLFKEYKENFVTGTGEYHDLYKYKVKEIFSNNVYSPSLTGTGNHIGYGIVRKHLKGISSDNGTIESHFSNSFDINNESLIGTTAVPSICDVKTIENGLLKKQIFFDESENPIKEVENTYNKTFMSRVYYGAKRCLASSIGHYQNVFGSFDGIWRTCSQNIISYYPIFILSNKLTMTKESSFGSNNTTTTTTIDYQYFGNGLIKNMSLTNSDGKNIKTQYDYSFNTYSFLYWPSELYDNSVLNNMKADNQLNTVIREIQIQNSKTIDYKFNIYKRENGLNLPYQYLSLNSGEGESHLREHVSFDKYNANGQVLQYHLRNDIEISLFWGYNNQYPVARIDNLSYSYVESNTNGIKTELEKLDDYTTITSSNRTSLKQLNATIREALPANALITTYTYDPLVGMTSETDPNGRTTYYEYDAFGRLEYVRDQDYNILKKHEYHYATQNP